MFPWMKEHLEAWNSRRNSRSAKRHSLNSNDNGMQTASSENSFLINVISLDGNVLYIPVTLDFTVEKVKSIATEHFYGHDKNKQASKFRLVHATVLKSLTDDKTLKDEEISESDELLMIEVRTTKFQENLSEEALKGPTIEEIMNATKNLPAINPVKPKANPEIQPDFQNEIRRILITLAQASAKVLMFSPDAINFYEILKEKLENQLKPPNDPKAVKYLVDMGFSERKALKALRLRKMNTSEALEWLLEHQDDPDEEDDLQLPPLESLLNEAGPSTSGSLQGSRWSFLRENFRKAFNKSDASLKNAPNLVHIVNLLLDNFRQCQKMDFRPDPFLVQSLLEAGFEKQKILEALKITGNNHDNACAWLLGERRPSLQNLYDGMDPEGPIYEAIMTNPQIQLSLTNPKMLLAYLSMLESPMSTSVWMKDPQVSPVLNQIFKTYHAEKHAIQVNRYNDS